VPVDIDWSVLFAGGAAVFSLLSVVVGRLNYADDELSRQGRIENRILNRERRLEYERPPHPQSSSLGITTGTEILADAEPEYRFQVNEVLVSENQGWRYLINKVVHGFNGEVSVAVVSTRWKGMTGAWIPELPPDFEQIEEFDFKQRDMMCDIREDAVVVTFQHADVERVSDGIDDLLDHLENELAEELIEWDTDI